MPPRFVVSLLAVPALALERFGYYAMRASFMTILSDRKTDEIVISTLYTSMRTWGIALTFLFALVAIVVARPVVAMLGVLTASIAAAVCVFGPESAFVSGLWFMVIGASAFKAVAFALCAEFVSSARMKVALVFLAFVALNAGATNGTDLAILLPTSLYPSLIAYVLATLVTVLLLGLSLLRSDEVKNEDPAKSMRRGAALFLLVVPTLNAMWIAYDTILTWQTTTGVTIVWLHAANTFGVMGLTMLGAILFAILPARLLPSVGLGALMLGTVLVAVMVTAVAFGWPQSFAQGVGLVAVAGVAELALSDVALALCIAMASPRFVPLLVATSGLLTSVSNVLGEFPNDLVRLIAVGLLLLGLPLAVLIVALRKPLLESLVPQPS